MSQGPPPPYPSVPPQKKGLPPLAWAGIGCGGLVILAGILFVFFAARFGMQVAKKFGEHPGKAAAEAVITANPDLEKTTENAEAGEVTLRLKSSGESIFTKYDDLVFGLTMAKDAAGNPVPLFKGDLTKVPAWVPRYPAASGETSILHQDLPDRITGILAATTTDSTDDVSKFFEAEASKLSLNSKMQGSADFNGAKSIHLRYSGGKRELIVHGYGFPGSPLTIQTIYRETK